MKTRRLRLTQGRVYSLGIVAVVAALLLPSLAHWKPAVALKPLSGVTFQKRPPPSATGSPSSPGALGSPAPAVASPTIGLGSFPSTAFPSLPVTSDTGLGATPPPTLLTAPAQSTVPSAPTCKAAALNATTTKLLNQLDASLKIIPTATVETALGLATGCNNANPALLAVGALSELGDDLSTLFNDIPGASALKVPTVHALKLPAAVLPVLATLKPVFSPVCAEINTAANIVILIAPHYPQVIDGASALALFQAAVTCGELTGEG